METGRGITSTQGGKQRRLIQPAWPELVQRFDGAGLTIEEFSLREGKAAAVSTVGACGFRCSPRRSGGRLAR